MWNPKSTLLPFAFLGLAAFPASLQEPEPNAELVAQIKALEGKVESLESYVKKQAKAAEQLSSAVDSAVAEGFTAGINYKSREILVKAWKASAKAQSETEIGKGSSSSEKSSRRRR